MDIFSYNIYSHPIDIYSICDICNMRVSMSSVSGYEKVALKAIGDVRRKDHLRKICETETEFKYKWRMECRKKEEKKRAIQEGTWKTQLDRVSFNSEVIETGKTIRVKKGRFLVTIYLDCEKHQHDRNKPVSVCKKGRFLVRKYFVNKKPEVKKPVVTKKGRFLITTTY
jgi:hypothetical protein